MTMLTMIDLYPGDRRVDWTAYVDAGLPWCGAILKASQGTRYSYTEWTLHQRQQMTAAAGARYGVDFFDAFYHYIELTSDGRTQADFFWRSIEAAGGEQRGTLWAMVDVERGGQPPALCTRDRVEDVTRAFAARYRELSGRDATLYGGELLRSLGVRDRLGCGRSAVALYSAELRGRTGGTADLLRATGTDVEHLMLWQYRGTEPQGVGPRGYPMTAPGTTAPVDISAVTLPGGLEALRAGLSR